MPDEDGRSVMSYGIIAAEGEGDPRPVTKLYSVFSRPETSRERVLAQEAANLANGCGEPVAGQTRILVSEVDTKGSDLVAVPTSKGFVAYGLLPMGGGGCGRPLQGGMTLAGDFGRDAVLHYGLVPDDVESVEVVLDGVAHNARIGENGFAVEVKGASQKNRGQVVVHRRDGTTQRY